MKLKNNVLYRDKLSLIKSRLIPLTNLLYVNRCPSRICARATTKAMIHGDNEKDQCSDNNYNMGRGRVSMSTDWVDMLGILNFLEFDDRFL